MQIVNFSRMSTPVFQTTQCLDTCSTKLLQNRAYIHDYEDHNREKEQRRKDDRAYNFQSAQKEIRSSKRHRVFQDVANEEDP